MDVLMLSRMQFGFATFIHFLFVPLTLGLSVLVAVMETRYVKTGDEIYLRMARFWGRIFLINFAMGVVTGITLEFQFGTNWSRYSAYVGDVFGSLLAIEALGFFFLESTLLGVWIFGWRRISARAHATVMWLVALASTGSALWILTANAWMQHPVGYVIRNGRAELADFVAVLTNKFAILMILHTISAAYVLSAFFVMGISALHLLRKREPDFFSRSFRIALVMGVLASFFIIAEGHLHGADLAEKQPAKLAAMESHWETSKAAPIYLFAWPDQEMAENSVAIGPLPGLLSLLAHHDPGAEVKGLREFPADERPPVLISFLSFRIMVGLGMWFALMTVIGLWRSRRLAESGWYLKLMVLSLPLPYLACELGWMLAEVGRQPWIVYGLMKTRDAFSPITAVQGGVSLAAFFLVYMLLTAVAFYLIVRAAGRVPDTRVASA
ncbi:MAG: cytochrome ubiquinol oxidase subunit I [Proteobacteria bacterium]|nr:cytochrome ubiquinol oxidase subunit I [Pseudomonadota bacterium]